MSYNTAYYNSTDEDVLDVINALSVRHMLQNLYGNVSVSSGVVMEVRMEGHQKLYGPVTCCSPGYTFICKG